MKLRCGWPTLSTLRKHREAADDTMIGSMEEHGGLAPGPLLISTTKDDGDPNETINPKKMNLLYNTVFLVM